MKNIQTNLTKFSVENIDQILYNLNMSVRQIKKSYISCTGYFPSYKNKKQMMFESILERDFFMQLEFDKEVIKYQEQPMTIKYKHSDGNIRKYTPDVLVTYKHNYQKIFEVKYQNEIDNDKELREKIRILTESLYEEHVQRFEIFTDKYIDNIYMDNLKFLYNYAFMDEDQIQLDLINNILNNTDKISVKELIEEVCSSKNEQLMFLPHIWKYLFLHTNRVVNLYEKLTMNTILEKKIY